MGAAEGIVAEYEALRRETDAELLAMQVGDFYEFFNSCAHRVNEELGLKLSEKRSGGDRHPMAGVPVDEIDRYANALVERGLRVAIADQHETDDGHARAIERVVTPGTSLEEAAEGMLIAVANGESHCGLAAIDLAGGRAYVEDPLEDASTADLIDRLAGWPIAELVLGPEVAGANALEEAIDAPVVRPDPAGFHRRRGAERVNDHFGDEIIATLGLADVTVKALGGALAYLDETDPALSDALSRLQPASDGDHVTLDDTTQRNLELTATFRGDAEGSLFDTIDHTVSTPGRRTLKRWLRRPTRDQATLEDRLDGVAALTGVPMEREVLRDALAETSDIARIAARAAHGSASPADLGRARDTLLAMPQLWDRIADHPDLADSAIAELLEPTRSEPVTALADHLDEALVDEPPPTLDDGHVIRHGFDAELDTVIDRHESLKDWFASLPQRERDRHGFETVDVDHTQTAGYYLQIPEAEVESVPESYRQVQTVAAGVRFRTDELAERERALAEVAQRRREMEVERFERLRSALAEAIDDVTRAGEALAALDVRLALAEHAASNDWVRPSFREDGTIAIDQGRHPVVEQTTRFVPNDVRFDDDHEIQLVTGPNMSGKSTYLRQVALIVLLAQIGSFVPADRAAITPVDGIFTRVGALDELAEGRSTFMVEMQELARILHRASDESLVILDEVGRGTATYDGLSLAWAATEYLHNVVGARALFATHYHELTSLADHLQGVTNRHVAVEETDDGVVFLRTVEPGPTDRSYGIHVADMAGVPDPVVDRADVVLDRLREERAVEARGRRGETTQVVFDLYDGETRERDASGVEPAVSTVLEAIETIDLDREPPIEVVRRVRDWQATLDDDEA